MNVYGFNESQYARIAAMLREYETGALGASDKPRSPPRYHPENHIRFHNDSGEAIPPFAVMRITDVNRTGTAPWRLKCSKPNTTFYNVYLVNSAALCPVSDNGWGTYLFDSGDVLCDDTYTPTVGEEWGPTSGSWALVRHRPGFLIDGGPTGTGSAYRAVAKQRIVTLLRGILTTELVEAGSCTVNLRLRNSDTGLREASGITVTAYDDFLGPGETWPVSTRVVIDFEGGIWNVIQASCEPDSGGGGGGSGSANAGSQLGFEPAGGGDYFPGGLDFETADYPYGLEQEFDSIFGN